MSKAQHGRDSGEVQISKPRSTKSLAFKSDFMYLLLSTLYEAPRKLCQFFEVLYISFENLENSVKSARLSQFFRQPLRILHL